MLALLAGCGSSSDKAAQAPPATPTPTATPAEDALERMPEVPAAASSTQAPTSSGGTDAFLHAVFDDVQAMWKREFAAADIEYVPATITIFRDEVETACGTQPANVGPFYCPADHGVYMDPRFFEQLSRVAGVRLGDFAQAYVVGHEVAHHVQVLLGIAQRLHAADQQDPAGENARSVLFELQADCLAGVWKHSAYQREKIDQAAIADALNAAAAVGSDFTQARTTGVIRPEDWTHGSSRQRQHWLTVGFEQGVPGACDTFRTR